VIPLAARFWRVAGVDGRFLRNSGKADAEMFADLPADPPLPG
jgi:hypothetical protein